MNSKLSLSNLFEAIDSRDADRFASFLTDDAVFRYGSQEPVRGRGAVRDYVSAFFATVDGLKHRLDRTWEDDGSLVCEGEVTYQRKDGKEVTLPFANVFQMKGDRVRSYSIYIDPSPLMG